MNRTPALIAAVIAVAVLAGCSSGPPPVKSDGTLTLMANPLGGDPVSEAYPDVTDGSQVVVTDSSGKVIGTGTLSPDAGQESVLRQMTAASLKVDADLLAPDIVVYQFTVTVPGGLDRYGGQGRPEPGDHLRDGQGDEGRPVTDGSYSASVGDVT